MYSSLPAHRESPLLVVAPLLCYVPGPKSPSHIKHTNNIHKRPILNHKTSQHQRPRSRCKTHTAPQQQPHYRQLPHFTALYHQATGHPVNDNIDHHSAYLSSDSVPTSRLTVFHFAQTRSPWLHNPSPELRALRMCANGCSFQQSFQQSFSF